MMKIEELQREQWVLLWSRERQLIMQYKEGERWDRAVLLADDYACDLETVTCGDTVYYVYRNGQGELVLRNVRDNRVYYRTKDVALGLAVRASAPVLWIWAERGVEAKESEGVETVSGELQLVCPLAPSKSRSVIPQIPLPAAFWTESGQGDTYVVCGSGHDRIAYRIDGDFRVWKGELTEESRVREQEEKLRQMLSEKDLQIERLQAVIESASKQYEELMHVAELYRDEAVKWRSKFSF